MVLSKLGLILPLSIGIILDKESKAWVKIGKLSILLVLKKASNFLFDRNKQAGNFGGMQGSYQHALPSLLVASLIFALSIRLRVNLIFPTQNPHSNYIDTYRSLYAIYIHSQNSYKTSTRHFAKELFLS